MIFLVLLLLALPAQAQEKVLDAQFYILEQELQLCTIKYIACREEGVYTYNQCWFGVKDRVQSYRQCSDDAAQRVGLKRRRNATTK